MISEAYSRYYRRYIHLVYIFIFFYIDAYRNYYYFYYKHRRRQDDYSEGNNDDDNDRDENSYLSVVGFAAGVLSRPTKPCSSRAVLSVTILLLIGVVLVLVIVSEVL